MSTWLTPVLIGGRPLDPHFTGDALLWTWHFSSGGQNLSGVPFLLPGHWALSVQNLVEKCVEISPPALAEPGWLVRDRGIGVPFLAGG